MCCLTKHPDGLGLWLGFGAVPELVHPKSKTKEEGTQFLGFGEHGRTRKRMRRGFMMRHQYSTSTRFKGPVLLLAVQTIPGVRWKNQSRQKKNWRDMTDRLRLKVYVDEGMVSGNKKQSRCLQ